MKLNKKELKEPMFVTWGRIITIVRYRQKDERLKLLAEKFNKDLEKAHIEEGYFNEK